MTLVGLVEVGQGRHHVGQRAQVALTRVVLGRGEPLLASTHSSGRWGATSREGAGGEVNSGFNQTFASDLRKTTFLIGHCYAASRRDGIFNSSVIWIKSLTLSTVHIVKSIHVIKRTVKMN